jgi:uncharacterized circularly permuted ATP-grasp superfamily protein/uncharacterized alpha-E superfamily protein
LLAYSRSVKDATDSNLFSGTYAPADIAAGARAGAATPGHFDELRGRAERRNAARSRAGSSDATFFEVRNEGYTEAWSTFFENIEADGLGSLNQRATSLARQVRDNGVTYNVYSDAGGPQRPWSLDLFPLIVSPQSWQHIEVGVRQRVRLLDHVMADVYGPQLLLKRGLLPPALVQGHPGYLRAMHGVPPVGGTHLHIAAFDLARGPDGNWWVVSQSVQAPSGLGYLLENRLAVSRLFPQAFEQMNVQRLAGTYRALMDSLRQMSPVGADAHIALLTPGPYNETYFEHAYLARYLGLTLVEGSDLIVRDQHLYLKTLKGLEPVHGLLKRLDDEFLDPLELRSDSTLGVPGLLQAIRAGNVVVANAPGSAFLESPALLGFLPALSRHLLGEELQLPALPTWWCGERSAMEAVLPRLQECAIKPTYPGSTSHGNFDAVLGCNLGEREIEEWAGRIALHSDDHTIQAYLPLSQMPTWRANPAGAASAQTRAAGQTGLALRSVILRVFAVSDGPQSWRVLPGGLARVAGTSADIASMQRGGSSADVWVLTTGAVDQTTLLKPSSGAAAVIQRKRMVTSRAGENMFWLGRYTERTENLIGLARLTLECLHGEDQSSQPLLSWLSKMATANTLVLPGVPAATQARRVFERSLIASLGSAELATSVGYNLRAVRLAGSSVRERLSQEHWNLIVRAEEELTQGCLPFAQATDYSPLEALRVLKGASDHMAAITGAQTDRMTRDDGWRLLSIGRHIERLGFLARSLASGFETGSVLGDGGFEAMIALFDSTIPFHAQYQQSRDVAALLDLLVLDRDNPRSLGWVAQTLRGRLAKLAGSQPNELSELSLRVPDPASWGLAQLCGTDADGRYTMLQGLLLQCSGAAYELSEQVGAIYFTHSDETNKSVGA